MALLMIIITLLIVIRYFIETTFIGHVLLTRNRDFFFFAIVWGRGDNHIIDW